MHVTAVDDGHAIDGIASFHRHGVSNPDHRQWNAQRRNLIHHRRLHAVNPDLGSVG
jgi:hypothetical protein